MQSSSTQIPMPNLANFFYFKVGKSRVRHLATIVELTKDLLIVQFSSLRQRLFLVLSGNKSIQG
jgi:hypothetical protein